jgi:hypothetical protein
MPPPGVKRGRQASGDGIKMLLVILATLLLLAGGAAAWWFTRQPAVDRVTLCPASGPTGIHAVLIDRSDPITPLQATRVRQVLEQAVLEAPVGARIALYVAESDGITALSPELALCNPGRDANPIYQNPRMIREQYEQQFKSRLDAAITRLLAQSTRQTSPIMESLKAVCIDAFGAQPVGAALRMTLVSDLIQHSPAVSHIRDRDYEALLRSPRLQALVADCKGASVEIVYLLRPTQRGQPGIQTRAHQSFWDRYLQRVNARPRSMEPV